MRSKTDSPKISVIMGIYNQWNKDYLEQAIMSVLRQSFWDFEFLIYDDGSEAIVREQLEKYRELDSRIVLMHGKENCGLAYSLNTCIDAARGKYLARMDDDDICAPDRLFVQYAYMEAHPEIAYVGCNAGLMDDNGVWGSRQMPEFPTEKSFLRYSPFIHPTVMLRKSIFQTQEAYRFSAETWRCEDYELFMRLTRLGYQGANIQQELFYYRENQDSYKKRKLRYRFNEMKLRYRNFREMGLLNPLGMCYVLRPLAAALVPSRCIYAVKRLYHRRERAYGSGQEGMTATEYARR